MGSSAASAAASAWAVNSLFGTPLSKEQLIIPGLISEATVSGYHADNIAPALLGGFVLIRLVSSKLKKSSQIKCFPAPKQNVACSMSFQCLQPQKRKTVCMKDFQLQHYL